MGTRDDFGGGPDSELELLEVLAHESVGCFFMHCR